MDRALGFQHEDNFEQKVAKVTKGLAHRVSEGCFGVDRALGLQHEENFERKLAKATKVLGHQGSGLAS